MIRPATLDDIPAMHVVRVAVRENTLSSPDLVTPAAYREMLEQRGRGWVSEAAGRIVGFAVADRTDASIWALFVDPDFEGRGIGQELHDAAVAWLFAHGIDGIWLTTAPASRAERFYRRAGWVAVSTDPSGDLRFELRAPA